MFNIRTVIRHNTNTHFTPYRPPLPSGPLSVDSDFRLRWGGLFETHDNHRQRMFVSPQLCVTTTASPTAAAVWVLLTLPAFLTLSFLRLASSGSACTSPPTYFRISTRIPLKPVPLRPVNIAAAARLSHGPIRSNRGIFTKNALKNNSLCLYAARVFPLIFSSCTIPLSLNYDLSREFTAVSTFTLGSSHIQIGFVCLYLSFSALITGV